MNHEGSEGILFIRIIAVSFGEQRIDPQFANDVTGFNHCEGLLRDVEHMPISNLYLAHQELGDDQLQLKLDRDFGHRGARLAPHQLDV